MGLVERAETAQFIQLIGEQRYVTLTLRHNNFTTAHESGWPSTNCIPIRPSARSGNDSGADSGQYWGGGCADLWIHCFNWMWKWTSLGSW